MKIAYLWAEIQDEFKFVRVVRNMGEIGGLGRGGAGGARRAPPGGGFQRQLPRESVRQSYRAWTISLERRKKFMKGQSRAL